jgi:phage portal protein BeeE
MLGRLFGARVEERAITSDPWGVWPGDGGTGTWSGTYVTEQSAMQLGAVYGCVALISDVISTLPVDCFRKTTDGRVEFPAPAWITEPTVDLDFQAWCGQVLVSLLLHGNAYVSVNRNDRGQIVELVPMDPCQVRVRRVAGRKTFWVNGMEFKGEIEHVPGRMLPGADVGLAAQEFGSSQFGEGLNMPGIIEASKPMAPETMREIADNWKRKRSKGNRGLPGVLSDGATWKATGVTNEQAQFLATRQFTDAQIAGEFFLIDPSEFGIPLTGTTLEYKTLESRNIRLVQRTLLPWIVRVERLLSRLLYNPRYVKLNVDGLQRGDLKARWETYEIASRINTAAAAAGQQPVLLTSEMRTLEDRAPITGPLPTPPKEDDNVPVA